MGDRTYVDDLLLLPSHIGLVLTHLTVLVRKVVDTLMLLSIVLMWRKLLGL